MFARCEIMKTFPISYGRPLSSLSTVGEFGQYFLSPIRNGIPNTGHKSGIAPPTSNENSSKLKRKTMPRILALLLLFRYRLFRAFCGLFLTHSAVPFTGFFFRYSRMYSAWRFLCSVISSTPSFLRLMVLRLFAQGRHHWLWLRILHSGISASCLQIRQIAINVPLHFAVDVRPSAVVLPFMLTINQKGDRLSSIALTQWFPA